MAPFRQENKTKKHTRAQTKRKRYVHERDHSSLSLCVVASASLNVTARPAVWEQSLASQAASMNANVDQCNSAITGKSRPRRPSNEAEDMAGGGRTKPQKETTRLLTCPTWHPVSAVSTWHDESHRNRPNKPAGLVTRFEAGAATLKVQCTASSVTQSCV